MNIAIVLAGGQKTGLLEDPAKPVNEALIPIGKRLMVEYVVEALSNSVNVRNIIIAGPKKEMAGIFSANKKLTLVPCGDTTIGSLLNALEAVPADFQDRVLVVTADIPLLTTEAVDDFINVCRDKEGELFYPIVSKEANEEKYPGVQRTYVNLKEGIFTGGNIVLIDPRAVKKCVKVAEELVRLRKSPISLAFYVGWGLLLRYLLGILSLRDAEDKVSKLLGIKGTGIISSFPEIGIDVDKQSDLALVKKKLVG